MWKIINPGRVLNLRSEQSKGESELQKKLLPNGSAKQKSLVRKISRSRSQEKESVAGDNKLAQEDGSDKKGKVAQSSSDSNLQQKSKNGELKPGHPKFGPYYAEKKRTTLENIKDMSYIHVLEKTALDGDKPDKPMVAEQVKQLYMSTIKKVQNGARELYADELSDLPPPRFRDMMIKDGCFFLQLALLIVGKNPEKLGYASEDAFFGKKPNANQIKVWIEAMFFVGNQIPLVVLNALLKQEFFKDVIREQEWEPAPSSLFQKVLYNLLTNNLEREDDDDDDDMDDDKQQQQQPSDCLHLLQDLILGQDPLKKKDSSSINEPDNEQDDLEANMESVDERSTDYLDPEEESQSTYAKNDEKKRVCPSATTLNDSFIFIRKLKNGDGVRRIHFESWYFFAILYLPEFQTGKESEMIFKNLTTYETSQKNNGGEVTSYIRLMRDIVRTAKDVKYLRKKKILQYPKGDVLYEDELPQMLEKLSNQEAPLTYDFRILKHKIADYSGPPWNRIKSILNLVALLTLLQTVFTMLSYLHPQPQSRQ